MSFSTLNIKNNLSLEEIEQKVPSELLWKHYLKEDIILGQKILSPVREESNPSAGFFQTSTATILLKDFGTGKTYNLVQFLQEKFKWSYTQAIEAINKEFNFGQWSSPSKDFLGMPVIKTYTSVKVKRKAWNKEELQYWESYYIDEKIRKILHIDTLSWYLLTNTENKSTKYTRKKDEMMYCFSFGNAYYKIYRPFSLDFKWYSNTPNSVLMGYDSLPWLGDTLIITKGMKELGQLRALEIPSLALQGESSYPNQRTVEWLKRRFKTIYTLMDNDKAGLSANQGLKDKFNFKIIHIPNFEGGKDLAEYSRIKGLEETNKLIKEQL